MQIFNLDSDFDFDKLDVFVLIVDDLALFRNKFAVEVKVLFDQEHSFFLELGFAAELGQHLLLKGLEKVVLKHVVQVTDLLELASEEDVSQGASDQADPVFFAFEALLVSFDLVQVFAVPH